MKDCYVLELTKRLCKFDRDDYLRHADQFVTEKIVDADIEKCEFSDDIVDMAFELAYTRFCLALVEKQLEKLN